jgi:hypothetical protein
MPALLTPAQREHLRSGALCINTLIDFHLDSGRVSFWDGGEPMSFEGQSYLPASEFGEIGVISLGKDLGAEGLVIKLNGTALIEAAGFGDPAALFGQIEQETYQMRRVDVRFLFTANDTGEVILLRRRYAGFIDQMRQVEEIGEDGAMISWLEVAVEPITRRYGVRGGRTRSHDDQQDIFPGDTGFLFTSSTIEKVGTLYWGRKAPNARRDGVIGLWPDSWGRPIIGG